MNYLSRIIGLKKKTSGYWAERIIAQLEYSTKLSKINKGSFGSIITEAVNILDNGFTTSGVIGRELVIKVEKKIAELSPYAKKYSLLNVAHAHIDMNWMWDYSETVAITLGTFRTMLDLMAEYPDFTFSQSQASVYKIVEEYAPKMLEEIKQRIHEGRWEVSASTWVEADKNMPNGESHARHILYTQRYLTNLLDLSPDELQLDFEPDTFGQNINVPEILSKGGIKYYYHCRGYDGHNIYKWESPSGRSIIVFRDPMWYNLNIDAEAALYVPEFCEKYGMDSVMKVYGVGNHGGGPTRRDIERLIDMNSWPVFPNIRFSTYTEYFKQIEKIKETLPVVKGELNFVFTGCYTTHSRIKMSNRIGEAKLDEAESISSLAGIFANKTYPLKNYEKAWRKILFNQFHDILPGSGTIDTREYAMGEFQKVMAHVNTGISDAMNTISSRIDTQSLSLPDEDISSSRSEGGGVGFEIGKFNVPHPERGVGLNRIINVFNPTQFERKETSEILIWDWEGEKSRINVKNSTGQLVGHQILEFNGVDFWAHTYIRLLIDTEVPAYGYATYLISECEATEISVTWPDWPRLETQDVFVLENEYIKAAFDNKGISLKSLVDKATDMEMIKKDSFAGFRFINEDPTKGMTAWMVGRYMSIESLSTNIRVVDCQLDSRFIRQWIKYEQEFKESKLSVTISLDRDSNSLKYDVECDWQERALVKKSIPHLDFHVPLEIKSKCYRYDIPFGVIDREPLNHDVPANSWIAGIPADGDRALMLISKTKYGFRGEENSLSLTLLRSSYDPDPYPDNCSHNFSFALAISGVLSNKKLIRNAYVYNHPLQYVAGRLHKGDLKLTNEFINVKSKSAVVSAMKMTEDLETGLVLRLYEVEGSDTDVHIKFSRTPIKAYFVDMHEKPIEGEVFINESEVHYKISAYNIESIIVEF